MKKEKTVKNVTKNVTKNVHGLMADINNLENGKPHGNTSLNYHGKKATANGIYAPENPPHYLYN